MRIIFMGSPEFSVPTLRALKDAGHDIVCVYCQPPRPAGRGQKPKPCAVHRVAESLGLQVRTPPDFKNEHARAEFIALNSDLAIVVAYGLILPQDILDAPRLGCINIHPSLLPRWRGAAPIQRAIMAGDEKTGVCLMQMSAGLDTGAVLDCAELAIKPDDTAASLGDNLAELGAARLLKALPDIENLHAMAQDQDDARATYAKKITKEEARIDWTQSARAVQNHIHGLSPFPGAWFSYKGERIKVLQAQVVESAPSTATAGEVLDDTLTIACQDGVLRLLRLQRAGKSAMDTKVFLCGFPIPRGENLLD